VLQLLLSGVIDEHELFFCALKQLRPHASDLFFRTVDCARHEGVSGCTGRCRVSYRMLGTSSDKWPSAENSRRRAFPWYSQTESQIVRIGQRTTCSTTSPSDQGRRIASNGQPALSRGARDS